MSSEGRIFYGWWVVAAAAAGLIFSSVPLIFGSFGVFLLPLTEEFGWSRAEVSLALTGHVAGMILISPLIGLIVDRFGGRRVIILSFLFFAAALAAHSLIGALMTLYVAYFMTAVLGAGTSPVAYSKIITEWFDRRRGLALGVTLAGWGIGTASSPVIAQLLVAEYGWRGAYIALAVLMLIVALPPALLLLRNDPSEMGLHPDGDSAEKLAARSTDAGFSLAEAARTKHFWVLAGAFLLVAISFTGTMTHLIPMISDRGVSLGVAASVQAAVGVTVVFGRLGTGYLLDKYSGEIVAVAAVSMTAIGIALVVYAPTGYLTYLGAICMGLSAGAEIDVMTFLTARYFGKKSFASIYGWLYAAYWVGAAVGPVWNGRVYDQTGSYSQSGFVFIGALLISAVAFSVLRSLAQGLNQQRTAM